MPIPTLLGITSETITTPRLTTRVLFAGAEDGVPVLFLHGNTSSATWWEEVMTSLPTGFRGIAPDQRGYGDADRSAHIDATRGLGDLADDALALLDHLGLADAHVVGNSMGGNVVWRLLLDRADRIRSATQVDPGSPYGFGGTRDAAGTPTTPDFAGSGGGIIAGSRPCSSARTPCSNRSGWRRALRFRPAPCPRAISASSSSA